MYEKILLLMDCSPVDDVIVDHIVELAAIHTSTVHLFHVVHAHTLDQERLMTARAEKCLSKAYAVFEKNNIPVKYSYSEGDPSELILAKITESDFDLVALATHGHKGLTDAVLGSVSRLLKHNISKPILMLRGAI
jgi:nucleotide-binding universal stress UspA family protein